ncbi:MAG: hypothetical protein ABI406_01365 [Ktedonobacteraceae bacterium]
MSQSEVARILRQIQMEYEAAERALKGPAFGTARHDFINRKMENMGQCQLELNELVGPKTAGKLIAETLNQSGNTVS